VAEKEKEDQDVDHDEDVDEKVHKYPGFRRLNDCPSHITKITDIAIYTCQAVTSWNTKAGDAAMPISSLASYSN
jgi:hypothetical protein